MAQEISNPKPDPSLYHNIYTKHVNVNYLYICEGVEWKLAHPNESNIYDVNNTGAWSSVGHSITSLATRDFFNLLASISTIFILFSC